MNELALSLIATMQVFCDAEEEQSRFKQLTFII